MVASPGERQSAVAPAKVNLTLRVIGRRRDGFHDLESVIAKVTLYDGIDVLPGDGPAIAIECSASDVPTNRQNLIWKAAESLAARSGINEPLLFRLHKCIPAGAGLGGGSSDAACVLSLLNGRWRLGWSLTELDAIAAVVGSDVPLFLRPGAVVIRGRGETVETVQLPWRGWMLLVCPPFGVSTAATFSAWRAASRRTDCNPRDCLRTEFCTASALHEVMFNDLEEAVCTVEPRVLELIHYLERRIGRRFHITGSGSTLFTCADTHDEAQALGWQCSDVAVRTQVVRVIQ